MKNTFLKTIGTATLAILMMAMFAQISVSAQDISRPLEGVWNAQATAINCQTGAVIRTGPAILTFVRGGTMHDFGTGRNPATRSPGYGIWSFNSNGQYTSAFQFFIYHSDGTLGGRMIVRQQIQLNSDENSYTSTTTTQVLDVNGNVIMNGCSNGVGTRFQ